ncbi:hypothetical protein KUTeg_010106 [Tegillarca granosa]|uniref:GH16 domain-containing protein n=1 Tax=Tegillarca granosa TaxID=220873 RepID=A0ABQ9FAR7_TEGGR|nr:hypothetical protein KUTeg_010106 [Tegillarca granosa]
MCILFLVIVGAQQGDMCTGNAFYGCSRHGSSSNILNPVQSARIRSSRGFNFKYGKLEVEAKMPKGDWLWPAIWMLPKWYGYGNWPASGEIDIVESRDGSLIMDLSPPAGGFWEHGGLQRTNVQNPWRYATKMAPFDQEFFLIFNVAVGGTAYFPDHLNNSPYPKPWSDKSGTAPLDFWKQKHNWYPTWNPYVRNGEDAAMKVNYVRVWKLKA